ncbi:helix-turn-helix domain-containing protein [Candidatus Poribacteria bacterium]|nr:helix-turn-helix domain-containing protein [Candidatus Poribacteria bacterium]MYG08914.1 helix-turn-helix domain-containing protein [Candidatus Poribacteria bacterium]MYK23411.1 helix-turn-helix domain-containing protein [Candidatus Poribacteria bacterium]
MKLTFRYPVYPTKTQETTLFKWLDHLCDLQNSARHDRKVAWETEGESVSRNDQQRKLKVARERYADFLEVPQDMQVCALERTDKAFDGFYFSTCVSCFII